MRRAGNQSGRQQVAIYIIVVCHQAWCSHHQWHIFGGRVAVAGSDGRIVDWRHSDRDQRTTLVIHAIGDRISKSFHPKEIGSRSVGDHCIREHHRTTLIRGAYIHNRQRVHLGIAVII